MEEDHKKVYDLWAKYQYFEAAERGYDANAANAARAEFHKAKKEFEEKYGKEWI